MSSARVLVVEDDRYIRESIQELLESEGVDVATVGNGLEALEYLRAAPELPRLVLLDLMMPVLDGFGFRTAQAADPKISDVPVVLMTADGNAESRSRQIGVSRYLRKPLDIDSLLRVVGDHCG